MTSKTAYRISTRRQPSRRAGGMVAWLLIAGYLMQPVLAYLVTPVVSHDSKGQTVVVCTLQGERQVIVDLPQIGGAPQDTDTNANGLDHCPALKLFQLAGTGQVVEPLPAPPVMLYSVTVLDQTARLAHRELHFSAYSTRAPPMA